MDILKLHLVQYEQASGAKLNQDKTEGVWIGSELNKTDINIQVRQEIKVLGFWIDGKDCCHLNWSKKESEIKEDVEKRDNKNTNYKACGKLTLCLNFYFYQPFSLHHPKLSQH